jgi:hypothetical protein
MTLSNKTSSRRLHMEVANPGQPSASRSGSRPVLHYWSTYTEHQPAKHSIAPLVIIVKQSDTSVHLGKLGKQPRRRYNTYVIKERGSGDEEIR